MKQQINEIKRMQQLAGVQINENRELLDNINDLRKALFATRDLKRNAFIFLEDPNANELLDNLIGYLEEKITEEGGNL
jgi:hypothetical protein